jgi:ketopantoate reductase
MRILVLGAGVIGSVYAGKLLQAGEPDGTSSPRVRLLRSLLTSPCAIFRKQTSHG